MIDRRSLLAALAVVAGVAAAGSKAALALSAREEFYVAEHRWASKAVMGSLASLNFLGWAAGTPQESPDRWRLARRMVELQEISDKSKIEQALCERFADLWSAATRPI
ncbi:MAG: hypothetical protein ACHQAQ_04235 [Hyphomicrobiales bacterium]